MNKRAIRIVDHERAGERMAAAERMASLGTIAAGLAHEISNPISFILSNTQALDGYATSIRRLLVAYLRLEREMVERFGESGAELLREVEAIKRREDLDFISRDFAALIRDNLSGVERIQEIIQGLRVFFRADTVASQSTDVNDCVRAALDVLANDLKYHCHIETRLADLPRIASYPGQLVQVFGSLLINASQALPQNGGTIQVESRREGDGVEVSITDNGAGIPAEHLSELFTPFFTTKPVGQGTGLGLSVCYGVVRAHGGMITVRSRVGEGSCFSVWLPIEQSTQTVKEDL